MSSYDALAGNPTHFTINPIITRRVLITGAGSYIGESFAAYAAEHFAGRISIDTIDMIDGSWREASFSGYDTVFHVAGIAHADVGRVDEATKKKYYAVNCDLAIETAKKARDAGVGQFVFMSSAIVYGDSAGYGNKKHIDRHTEPAPAGFYGDSKWQADKALSEMMDQVFHVAILRPPMIYGRGSKGNYPTLARLADKLPIFPDIKNERSMLHIDNLCSFLCQLILTGEGGVYFPQNPTYMCTSKMVARIAAAHGKNIRLTRLFNPAISLMARVPGRIGGLANKAFGNLTYDMSLSKYEGIDYREAGFEESIVRTEGGEKRALMSASVASMIDLFSMDNIAILREMGYTVDVAASFGAGSITSDERVAEFRRELDSAGIESFDVPIPRTLTAIGDIARSYRLLRRLAKTRYYDIVHCQSPIGGALVRLAFRDRQRYGTRIVYTAHGFHFFDGADKKAWRLYYPAEKRLAKYTDVLITINAEDYERAQELGAGRVVYIPGIGVDTEAIRHASADRASLRAELGLSDSDFVFMSAGQLSVRKNQEIVIRALAQIPDDRVKYLIVGFGECEESQRTLAKELGIAERVIFAGYRGDVRELLHCVDAFVFPSLQEGLPVALMEAMSAGLPIVCSRIRGNVDLIKDGEGGYLCESRDEDAFAEAMKKVIDAGEDDLLRMRRANLANIRHFDISVVNKAMRELYKEV